MTLCFCGRRAYYGDHCYFHAPGLTRHRSITARKGAKTAKARQVKLCGARLHAMTPENTVQRPDGKRCRACAAAARMRYQRLHAAQVVVLPHAAPHVSRPLIFMAATPQRRYARELAEAKAEYSAWTHSVALNRRVALAEVA